MRCWARVLVTLKNPTGWAAVTASRMVTAGDDVNDDDTEF